jgi:hypothetical protein
MPRYEKKLSFEGWIKYSGSAIQKKEKIPKINDDPHCFLRESEEQKSYTKHLPTYNCGIKNGEKSFILMQRSTYKKRLRYAVCGN